MKGMMVAYKVKIGIYEIYVSVTDAVAVQEETKAKIESLITEDMTEKDIQELYIANRVYNYGPEADVVSRERGLEIKQKIEEAGDNRRYLTNGNYIADYWGCEYWIERFGKLVKETIEEIGIELPEGAVLPEDLTQEQQKAISAQQEQERIAALTPEKKAEEKENRIRAIAREANQKAEDAELMEESFDKKEWFTAKKEEIEAKYV